MSHRGIGFSLLKYGFPVVYALTVMPFTVQVFRRFVASPDVDAALVGLVPLKIVHELLLPFFVIGLELVSIQLAIGLWTARAGRPAVLAVLLALQMFPTFAVYFDARASEFEQLVARHENAKKLSPEVIAQTDAENRLLLDDYERLLQNYLGAIARRDADAARYEARSKDLQASIDLTSIQTRDAFERLRFPNTLAEREAAAAEVQRLAGVADRYRADQSASQKAVQALLESSPSVPPATRLKSYPTPVVPPFPYDSATGFLVATLGSMNSALSLFVATMFGFVVLGVGYLTARVQATSGDQAATAIPLDLEEELRLCGRLPSVTQAVYAKQLRAAIEAHFAAARSLRDVSESRAKMRVARAMDLVEGTALRALRRAIESSKVRPDARQDLISTIDGLTSASGS